MVKKPSVRHQRHERQNESSGSDGLGLRKPVPTLGATLRGGHFVQGCRSMQRLECTATAAPLFKGPRSSGSEKPCDVAPGKGAAHLDTVLREAALR